MHKLYSLWLCLKLLYLSFCFVDDIIASGFCIVLPIRRVSASASQLVLYLASDHAGCTPGVDYKYGQNSVSLQYRTQSTNNLQRRLRNRRCALLTFARPDDFLTRDSRAFILQFAIASPLPYQFHNPRTASGQLLFPAGGDSP